MSESVEDFGVGLEGDEDGFGRGDAAARVKRFFFQPCQSADRWERRRISFTCRLDSR